MGNGRYEQGQFRDSALSRLILLVASAVAVAVAVAVPPGRGTARLPQSSIPAFAIDSSEHRVEENHPDA